MEKKFVLGLDIGITSVGWGIIDLSTGIIVDKGVRLFPEGTADENMKRRQLRSLRRLTRRRRQRILDLRKLLKENGIIGDDFKPLDNPYIIRCEGLRRQLSNEELATALLHVAKRRGSYLEFDRIDKSKVSNLADYYALAEHSEVSGGMVEDNEEKAKENLATKAVLDENSKLLKKYNMHICELQLQRLRENGKIRANQNNFKVIDYLREVLAILKNQPLSDELKKAIIEIIIRKREYYEGPGSIKSPTPYGRYLLKDGKIIKIDLIEKMRGKCTIFPDEPRAPKMSYTADLFNLLNDLNNLDINGSKITKEQKEEIIEKYINVKGEITPEELCRYLNVEMAKISGFRMKNYEIPLLTTFEGYKKILKVVNNKKNPLPKAIIENKDYVDAIIEILTKTKGINERIEKLKKIDSDVFDDFVAEKIAGISGITQYHSLSLKAIKVMLPDLLETNDNQMQIQSKLGLFASRKEAFVGKKNIPFNDKLILSPVVKRAQNEAIKVINAVRKRYGELDSIVIEMARDRNSDEEKKRIKKTNKYFAELNEKAKATIQGHNVEFNAKLVNKIRLYDSQDCKCLYTGKPIDLKLLLNDPKAYEIDHIIPLSISLDDSMENKVLVYADANRAKENMTPFKYFASGKASGWNYEEYKTYVLSLYGRKLISRKKLQNLLFEEDITKYNVQKKFLQRNLVDTRYASKAILNTLQHYFQANGINTKVFTVRGRITDLFRKKAQLQKNRDYYYHHIVDALIVASIKKLGYMDYFFNVAMSKENTIYNEETGEVITTLNRKQLFPPEFIHFISKLRQINDATAYLENINISHKVDRKINRQFTDQTIYGVRKINDDYWRIGKIKDIYGDDGKKLAEDIRKGDTDKYFMKQVDPETFALLEKIVETTPVDKNENPFLKYRNEHGFIRKRSRNCNGPVVKSLRYKYKVLGSHVDVTHKYNVKNDNVKVVLLSVTTYRIDVYKSNEGIYKFLTIRNNDIRKGEDGFYIDWVYYNYEKNRNGITDDYEFLFSLHKNEVVEITKKTTEILRFVGVNNDKLKRLEFKYLHCDYPIINDKPYRVMIDINKKVTNMCKYNIDILGNRYKVSKEELKLRL